MLNDKECLGVVGQHSADLPGKDRGAEEMDLLCGPGQVATAPPDPPPTVLASIF